MHPIWTILSHKYRSSSKSRGISIPYEILNQLFKDDECNKYEAIIKGMKQIRLSQFIKASQSLIDKPYHPLLINEIKHSLQFLKEAQYGDYIFTEVSCDDHWNPLCVWILGYGFDANNIDPKNLHFMHVTRDLSGDHYETVPYSFGDAPVNYFSEIVYGAVISMNLDMFQSKSDSYWKLRQEVDERIKTPGIHTSTWCETEIIVDKFPHEYTAHIDCRHDEDAFIWYRHKELRQKKVHDKRIEYAKQKRKEKIRNLIHQTHCFDVDALIDLLVTYLV